MVVFPVGASARVLGHTPGIHAIMQVLRRFVVTSAALPWPLPNLKPPGLRIPFRLSTCLSTKPSN